MYFFWSSINHHFRKILNRARKKVKKILVTCKTVADNKNNKNKPIFESELIRANKY